MAGTLAGCGGGGSSPAAPSTPAPTPTPAPAGELRLPLMGVGETVAASVTLVGGLVTPLAVTRLSQTEAVTVSRICTHEGCTIALPGAPGATLDCPCHGSRFRTSGQVVNGPAARALSQFPTRIVGERGRGQHERLRPAAEAQARRPRGARRLEGQPAVHEVERWNEAPLPAPGPTSVPSGRPFAVVIAPAPGGGLRL